MILNRIDIVCRKCGQYLYVGNPFKENPMCDTCKISTLTAQLTEAKEEVGRLKAKMKTFEEYWENYGELHAAMCGGDIKQFAKEIWQSVVEISANEISTLKAALEKIRDEHGKVCNEYEVCTHISCASSHAAWTIAEQALERRE
jgi:hypothetical protein